MFIFIVSTPKCLAMNFDHLQEAKSLSDKKIMTKTCRSGNWIHKYHAISWYQGFVYIIQLHEKCIILKLYGSLMTYFAES
jgi:hypothetical protein